MSRDELETQYKEVLKDFAMHYVAIWNALRSLGLTDPQIKGAISNILEMNNGSLKDTMKEARQEKHRETWRRFVEGCEKRNEQTN